MLRLECTIFILAEVSDTTSTVSKFYTFTGTDKGWVEKLRYNRVGGPSFFSCIAAMDEALIRNSTDL